MPGASLAARSLARAFRQHKIRAVAALIAGVLGIAMTTAVLVVIFSVTDAIRGVPLSATAGADWAVQARSSSGLDARIVGRLRAGSRDAQLAPLLLVNTRAARGGDDPLLVVGLTREAASFAAPRDRHALSALGRAGPRELYLGRSWAAEHGVRRGSTLMLQTPGGAVPWRVGGLVDGRFANRGAVAVAALPEVASAFGRRGVVDLVLARGPGDRALLRSRLQAAAGGAAAVVSPGATATSYERAFSSVRGLLNVFVAIAALASGAILFFCWRLALEDARAHIARLRLVGASLRHLAAGSGLVLAAIFAVSLLLGAPLGLLLGWSLTGFTRELVTLTQLAGTPGVPIVGPVLGALAAGVVVFLAAWGSSLASFVRMPVIEAVGGRRAEGGMPHLGVPLVLATGSGVLGLLALLTFPVDLRGVALLPFLVLMLSLSVLAPALVGRLMRARSGFGWLSAGREIAMSTRRTAALLAVFALAIAMSLALDGMAGSVKQGIAGGVERWTRGDLFVQTAPSGANLQEDKFTPDVERRVAGIPGVESVSYFTYSTLDMHGTRISLWAWGRHDLDRFVDLDVTDGPRGPALWRALDRPGQIAVSSNYARLHDAAVGDRIDVPTADGSHAVRIAAIVDDLTSPAGVLIAAPDVYERITRDDRRYQLIVGLAPGAPLSRVRQTIRTELGGRYPGLMVYDRDAIRARFGTLTSRLVGSFLVFARLMFVLALLIGGAALATSLSLRRRALALARLCGATVPMLRRQLMRESIAVGVMAWSIAVPVGVALVHVLVYAVSAQSGLLPSIHLPYALMALSLPLAVLLSVLSLLVASPRGIPALATELAEE